MRVSVCVCVQALAQPSKSEARSLHVSQDGQSGGYPFRMGPKTGFDALRVQVMCCDSSKRDPSTCWQRHSKSEMLVHP